MEDNLICLEMEDDRTFFEMEDDLIFFQIEDDLNSFQMEDDLNFVLGNLGSWFLVCNIVSTQLDEIWKTTPSFLKMEDDLHLLKIAVVFHFQKI